MRTPIAVLVLLAAGCGPEAEKPANGDTHEALAAESVETLATYLDVLEQVTDEKSARALRPRVIELRRQLLDIERRREALGEMTPEQQQALIDKYGARLDELGRRQGPVGMRILKDPVLHDILAEEPNGVSKRD